MKHSNIIASNFDKFISMASVESKPKLQPAFGEEKTYGNTFEQLHQIFPELVTQKIY